jgi:CRP-like cAMP-binding protein
MLTSFDHRPSNALLASLPPDEYQRVQRVLERVDLPFRKVLYKQDQPIDRVYFPNGGACSLVKVMQDRQAAEIATVGAEGVVGASVFFGQTVSDCEVLVQAPAAAALTLRVPAFTAEMERRSALYNSVIRSTLALSLQIQQTTACNALHRCEQRCCRWLLMMRDRSDSDNLKLTHELLATMLGVRRPTVTLVLGVLARAGLVAPGHHKGVVRILDREGLKSASCECYETIRTQMRRLVPRLGDSEPRPIVSSQPAIH